MTARFQEIDALYHAACERALADCSAGLADACGDDVTPGARSHRRWNNSARQIDS